MNKPVIGCSELMDVVKFEQPIMEEVIGQLTSSNTLATPKFPYKKADISYVCSG